MLHALHRGRHGFTLVELMIVVAIIVMLAALAVPNFLRARKRAQATRILDDLKLLNDAVDQYAIEFNKGSGDAFTWADLQKYLKPGTRLYAAIGDHGAEPHDLLGNPYRAETATIDQPAPGLGDISLNSKTFEALADVIPANFWAPYGIDTGPASFTLILE